MDLASSILLFKVCRWVPPSAKHAWSKTDNLTSILCRDWQSIDLRTLSNFPFIALSTINHTHTFLTFTINTSYQKSLQHIKRLLVMYTICSFHTCYPNNNLISSNVHNNLRIISNNNCFICIHTQSVIGNEMYYLYRGSQVIYFLFTWPLGQKV